MNVLVTGVSSGLGLGMAKAMLQRGDRVFGCARRDTRLEGDFHFRSIDLSKETEATRGLKELLSGVEQIDLAVLNAGKVAEIADMKDTSVESLEDMMRVNAWSVKYTLDALFEIGNVSQVVAISTGASVNGHRGWNGYSISKAALNMIIKLYATEQEDTHFSSMAPGLIDTAMQDYLCEEVDENKFPSVIKLKESRGTDAMPKPDEAGRRVVKAFPKLLKLDSGSYADIRKL